MSRGRFIALEGGEGVGKSTQARLLGTALEARGIAVVATREPGGTDGAEAIRELLLHSPGGGWNARAEALLFAAARSDHVEKLIRPALVEGKWVVCDRFVDSSRAYQGGAGGLGDDAIVALHDRGSEGLRPDLTVLLDTDPATAGARLAERDRGASDAIGGRDASYHAEVADTFRKLAEADPDGFRIVDAAGSPEVVHIRVMNAVAPLLATVR